MSTLGILVLVVLFVFVIFVQGVVWAGRYVKVGPNQALIISGRRVRLPNGQWTGFRIVKGGGTFVWPVFEKVDVLSLEVISLDMPKSKVRTVQGGPVKLDCLAQVKVKADDLSIAAATEHFVSKTPQEVGDIVRPILERHLSAGLDGLSLEEVNQNLDRLADKVQAAAAGDLGKMGLAIISFSIREIQPA